MDVGLAEATPPHLRKRVVSLLTPFYRLRDAQAKDEVQESKLLPGRRNPNPCTLLLPSAAPAKSKAMRETSRRKPFGGGAEAKPLRALPRTNSNCGSELFCALTPSTVFQDRRSAPVIHLLVVDDAESQYILIRHQLSALMRDIEFSYARDAKEALAQVSSTTFDVMLVDYSLGEDSGIALIRELHKRNIDTPMILMTGHGNREVDLQAMESGAVDYIDKGELRAATLERSVRYALRYYESLRKIKDSETQLLRVLSTTPVGVFIAVDEKFVFANPMLCQLTGYKEAALFEVPVTKLLGKSTVELLTKLNDTFEPIQFETEFETTSGRRCWVEVVCSLMDYAGREAVLGAVTDITERKRAAKIEHEQRILAEALLAASTAINSTLEIDQVMNRILEAVRNVIGHDVATIALIEEGHTHVVGYVGTSHERELRMSHMTIEDTPELAWMCENRRPLLIAELKEGATPLIASATKLRSYLGTPLLAANVVIGFINLYSTTPGYFTDEHVQRLEIFALHAVAAIRNAQDYERVQERAAVEERERLARDLHDAVSQTLFSANVMAESLKRIDLDRATLDRGLEKLAKMTKGALAEMRSLLLELRTNALVETDFGMLLNQLVRTIQSRTETQIDLNLHSDKIILPPDVQLGMYRMTQEALNNVVKHSKASRAVVSVLDDANKTEVRVEDDGQGFDVHAIPNDHMGLVIMKERAKKIDIECRIASQPGRGTRVSFLYPKEAHHD